MNEKIYIVFSWGMFSDYETVYSVKAIDRIDAIKKVVAQEKHDDPEEEFDYDVEELSIQDDRVHLISYRLMNF